MPHGHPDYGGAAPATTIYTIQDMAELAARLGSIVTFDRRGNVIWMDDFESGINKWLGTGTAGGSLTWSPTYARNGGFSCKMLTPASSSAYRSMYVLLPYPVLSRIGMEVSVHNEGNWKEFIFVLILYDGTKAHTLRITYEHSTHKFYYMDSAGNNQETGLEIELFSVGNAFNTIKVVADFTATDEYVRLIVKNEAVDLSGKALRQTSNPTAPMLSCEMYLYNSDSDIAEAYADDVILTQNEP